MKHQLKKEDLAQFGGTHFYYRLVSNPRVFYTEGMKHVADVGQAHWLLDAIAAYLRPTYLAAFIKDDPRIASMIVWTLKVAADDSALLEARADSPCEAFIKQEIPLTDFPLESLDVWAGFDGTNWVLYLPREH